MSDINISDYRKMLNIQRLAGTFKHRSYNLVEHSYYVAILFSHFAKIEGIGISLEILELVLRHDVVEILTGDLIYTVKNSSKKNKERWEGIEEEIINKNPNFKQFSDKRFQEVFSNEQFALFKVCDLLELWIFLQEEIAIGNKNWAVVDISNRCVELIADICEIHQFWSVMKFMEGYVPWQGK